jgi:hypothetical protein
MSDAIRIVGLGKLQARLTPELYAGAVKTILTKAAITGENLAKVGSPVDTGRLRASITHKVDGGNPPAWSKYGTNVKYARPLDQPVTRRPHYRSGPRRGQPTKGWLTDTLKDVKVAADGFVKDAVGDIEAKWRS